MKRALACALLLAVAAHAAPHWPKQGKRLQSPPAALRVLPAGGGQSGLVSLCPAATSVGLTTTFGVDGSGAACTGSVAVSSVGSPATLTQALCPNGPNCGAVTRQRFTTSDGIRSTATQPTPVGDAWGCLLFSPQDNAGNNRLFTLGSNATWSWMIELQSVTRYNIYIRNSVGTLSSTGGGTTTPGAPTLLCFTYDWIAAGSSILKLYVNGAQAGATVSTAVAMDPTASKYSVNGFSDNIGTMNMQAFGAVAGDGLPTDTQMSQLASAVLGSISGSAGEALTFARASAAGCEDDTGSAVTDLPNNRPCVTRGGLAVRPAWTELLLRTSELDNAAWVKTNSIVAAPVVTANTTDVADPGGAFTAEKIVYPAVQNVNEISQVSQAITGTVAPYSWGVWLRSLSGTSTIYIYSFAAAYAGVTACTVTTTWTRCKAENVTLTAAATTLYLGIDRTGGSGMSGQTAQTIYAWRYNAAQAVALPLGGVDATSATVSVAVESASVPVVTSMLSSQSGRYFAPTAVRAALQNRPLGAWKIDANNNADHYLPGVYPTNLTCNWNAGGVAKSLASTATLTAGGWYRLSCSWDGATMTACVNGACNSAAVAGTVPSGAGTFYPGAYYAGNYEADGIIADSCLGSSPGACR